MEWTELEEKAERALLVSLDTGEYDAQASLDELYELVRSAGADPVLSVMQKRPAPDTAFCVGTGMAEEIAETCRVQEIDLLVFDRELTPTQIRNIEEKTGVHTVDRTMLILDIFAQRARSSEGKLQVELAQLKYMLPRLTGKGVELSRLGGGVGTRGPGETKLESDRRHIRRRISALREQLEQVEKRREQVRRRREKDGVITVALVGYTNAGKSTLMNLLTQAGVLAEDRLFATLDPTARALKLPGGKTVMLIDTVGLVRRLPHHLRCVQPGSPGASGRDGNPAGRAGLRRPSGDSRHEQMRSGSRADGYACGRKCRADQRPPRKGHRQPVGGHRGSPAGENAGGGAAAAL